MDPPGSASPPSPGHAARITLAFPDEATAQAVAGAIAVEAEEGPEGSRVKLEQEGATLTVGLEAADVATLRASLHSVVRLADAAERTVALAAEPSHPAAQRRKP